LDVEFPSRGFTTFPVGTKGVYLEIFYYYEKSLLGSGGEEIVS
jgi:hypothetical protein